MFFYPCYLIKTYIPKCKKSGLQNFHSKIHRDVGNSYDEKCLMCIYTIKCENGDGQKIIIKQLSGHKRNVGTGRKVKVFDQLPLSKGW